MKISSPSDEGILTNILIGEVWVCSGQSNMEWSVKASKNPAEEIDNAKYPLIRLFHVPESHHFLSRTVIVHGRVQS